MRELMMFGLEQKSLAELEQLQAELRAEQDKQWKKRAAASGVVVSKGAGRRSGQVRARLLPGRRDSRALAEADAAIATTRRHLRYIEDELARRAAGEAARA